MAFLDKQVFLAGLSGPTGAGLDTASLATTADLTIDVNGATGNDTTGDGSAAKPFATIGKAMGTIPLIRKHIITVRVFTGTYAETIRDGGIYVDNGAFTGKVVIQGQNFTTPTLGSGGITSGTLGNAPATGCTRTVAGAVWNVNELKKYFVQITSGGLNGRYYPIAANAAGSLDIPDNNASLNGATFSIVSHACVVTNTGGFFMSVFCNNAGGNFGSAGLVIQRMKLACTSFYGLYAGAGGCQLLETLVDGQTFAGINIGTVLAQPQLARSYIQNLAGQNGIKGASVSTLSAGATVIDAGAFGIQIDDCARFSFLSGLLVVQNATTAGLEFRSGPNMSDSFSTSKPIIRGNAVGLRLGGGGRILMQNWEIVNNTSHGIHMVSDQYVTSHNSIHAQASIIQSNGGDGIRVDTSHNHIQFGVSGAISGNTGYGLKFAAGPTGWAIASHNSAMFDSTVTMGTNTAGDVTHDNGTTTKTIAQVRSDGAEISATLFNRVAAV